MPQITLKVSSNVNITLQEAQQLLKKLHDVLAKNKLAIDLDINTCNSGLIREDVSYIGNGNKNTAKCFYEILWLETEKRWALSSTISGELMKVLDEFAASLKLTQNLDCVPRIKISNLGELGINYFFSQQSFSNTNTSSKQAFSQSTRNTVGKSIYKSETVSLQFKLFDKSLKLLRSQKNPVGILAAGSICFIAGVGYSKYS